MKETVKAVIFDLGQVLIQWDPKLLYRKMFEDEKEMEFFLTKVCPPEWNASLDAGYPFADGVKDRIEIYPDYEPYIRAWHERWIETIGGEISGTVEILKQVMARDYRVFALSNWSAETFPIVAHQYEFLNWFEDVVLSGKEKLIKPNPEIYQRLLERANLKPEECIFIDDSLHNVEAARKMGIHAIQFESPEKLSNTLTELDLL